MVELPELFFEQLLILAEKVKLAKAIGLRFWIKIFKVGLSVVL